MTRRARIILAVSAALAAPPVGTAVWIAWPLPADVASPGPVPSLTVTDRHGLGLRTTRAEDGTRGGWISLAEMDPDLLIAFIAMEDRRFLEHSGVDLRAAARAARDNLRAGAVVAGGSTITMQTARLLRPMPRTWLGKVRQALWALRLEHHLDKARILELYLNRVPLGQGTRGVAAGASLYFGASASELSLGQAALLAGLAREPSRDNPLADPERARARRDLALRRMLTLGIAAPEDVARARAEPVRDNARAPRFQAPHFTTQTLQWAEAQGDPLVGTLRTSLDLPLQEALEAEIRATVHALADRGGRDGAAVVLHNATGEVLAWVGSPDFWADTAGQVDMVTSPRQPGSALKPFLYALAFDRGYTAASILPDVARTYQTTIGPYHPRNYDRRFHGPVRAREALASSYNVPAVELANRVGPPALLRTLRLAGFASLERTADHYGLGLALGNGDVSLLEVANGYRALANGGQWRPVRWQAVDTPDPAPDARRVVSAQSAALVLDILSDPLARIPGFGLETPFDFPFPVAVKTGTSRHFTDNWAVAVTGGFTVAVWTGAFSGRPMAGVSGVSGAGPLLRRAVTLTAARYAPGELPTPAAAGAIPVAVCRLSGLLAGPECLRLIEWFVPGTAPDAECDWHAGGRVRLPLEYAEWADQHGGVERWAHEAGDPKRDIARTAVPERFRILSPQEGDRYTRPPDVDPRYATIALRATGQDEGDGAVRWFVDGRMTSGSRWQLAPGRHTVRARSASGETAEVTIYVMR